MAGTGAGGSIQSFILLIRDSPADQCPGWTLHAHSPAILEALEATNQPILTIL